MTATNHALTGAVIGLSISNPLVAIPIAFLSHFVLDAIPHYGPREVNIGNDSFRHYLMADVSLCVLLVAILIFTHPAGWALAPGCAFVATSPDLMWLNDFLRAQGGRQSVSRKARCWLVRFHVFIQWFERPIGGAVEVAWCAGASLVLAALINAR